MCKFCGSTKVWKCNYRFCVTRKPLQGAVHITQMLHSLIGKSTPHTVTWRVHGTLKIKMYFWIVWQRNMKYSQKVWIFPSKLFENFLLQGICLRTRCQAAGHAILTRQKVKSPKKYRKSKFIKKNKIKIIPVCVVCTVCMVCSLHFNMTGLGLHTNLQWSEDGFTIKPSVLSQPAQAYGLGERNEVISPYLIHHFTHHLLNCLTYPILVTSKPQVVSLVCLWFGRF